MGCHALLLATFPTQGGNPGLSRTGRRVLYSSAIWVGKSPGPLNVRAGGTRPRPVRGAPLSPLAARQ